MKIHLHNLFVPHHGNNHKPKLLHNFSLFKLVLLVLFSQLILTGVNQAKPGVLGFASNIDVNSIVAQTNAERRAGGLSDLQLSPILSESARQKASHMFEKNYWAHNGPDGTSPWDFFKAVNYNYLYAGENLARDFNDSASVTKAWMESPTHRDNIMSGRYKEIGVAVVNGILNGQETTLVVQHFGFPATTQPEIPQQSAINLSPDVRGEKIAETKVPESYLQEEVNVLEVAPETEGVQVLEIDEKPQPTINKQNDDAIQFTEITTNSPAWLSSFDITKSVNLALVLVIIVALSIDVILVWQRKTLRRSGKTYIHLALFVLVALIIILTKSGNII